jgi:hypothetical protein
MKTLILTMTLMAASATTALAEDACVRALGGFVICGPVVK